MMTFLAAVLAGAAATTGLGGDASVSNLTGLFEATCLDGQAKLSAGDVTPIDFKSLPSALQATLGHPASGKVWQLSSSGHSYLYILEYGAAPGVSPKVCGLASDALDLKAGSDALEVRVAGSVTRNKPRSAQWLNVRDGYVATATTAAKLNVLQISWMSDADKAVAMEQVEQLPQ
jgi:hypothetical protein